MNRGMTGLLPRAPTLAAESQLGFYQTVRNFAIRDMFPRVAAQVEVQAASAGFGEHGALLPTDRIASIADPIPIVGTWKRIMRSQQQASWHIRDSLLADAARYEAELDTAERAYPGRLHYDPAFVTPEYAKCEIHLQPGGYVGDALAGYVFHHGTKVFYQGLNDQDQLHALVSDMVRVPSDGIVHRVLDTGCSIGQATTALKQRFANTEVWGLDVALPLVRYAHKRAIDMGIDVHFMQGLAEATGFPDGHFDAVLAHILFHEVPEPLFDAIIAEVKRLLRPGGTFTIVDAPNNTQLPVGNRLWQQFDARYNCEPYALAFVATDLRAMLERHGFRSIEAGPTPTFLWCTQAEKPLAT